MLNEHIPHEIMWNPVSWNPAPKEGGLLAKILPKHENRNYVDPLTSSSMAET